MLPKSHRFSFKKGAPRSIFSTPLFVLRYDHISGDTLHCAIVVGKKVDKRAVGRNKIKRMLTEMIEGLVSNETSFNIVLFAKKPITEVEKEKVNQELEKALRQVKIIK